MGWILAAPEIARSQTSGPPTITQLDAAVPPPVGSEVFTPYPGGAAVTAQTCVPDSRNGGCGPFTLYITGTNFSSTILQNVTWRNNNTGITTTFSADGQVQRYGSTQLSIDVDPSLFTAAAGITVTVNMSGGSASAGFTVNPPFVARSGTLPGATFNAPYSTTLFTGGTPPYHLVLTSGTTPPGMPGYGQDTQQANNLWSGTPTVLGGYTFQLKMQDLWTYNIGQLPGLTQNYSVQVSVPPTTSSIDPTSIAAGSPAFTLAVNGANFVPGTAVLFDGTPLSTNFISSTRVEAQVPASLVSTGGRIVGVAVRAPSGATSTPSHQFNVNNPTLFTFDPATRTAGGTQFNLSVTGQYFVNGTQLFFGTTGLTTSYLGPGSLSGVVPASLIATSGTAQVYVVNPGNNPSGYFTFNIRPAPVLTSLVPSTATAGVAFSFDAIGSNFAATDVLYWDNTPLPTSPLSGNLSATVTAALATPGLHNVTVRTVDGASSNVRQLTLNGPPSITSISPSHRTSQASGFTLTVNGSNFANGAQVWWGSETTLPTVVDSANKITANVDYTLASGTGTVTVRVRSADGVFSNSVNFTFDPPRTLTSINPTYRTQDNGPFTMTLTGTGFLPGDIAVIDGKPLTTSYSSPTQLTATITAGHLASPGNHQIAVRPPDASDTTSQLFRVDGLRTLLQFSPTSPRTAGFALNPFDFTGTNIQATDVLLWDSTPHAITFIAGEPSGFWRTSISAAEMTAGNHTLRVQSLDGALSNSLTFTVTALPSISSLVPNSATAAAPNASVTVNGSNFLNGMQVFWGGNAVNLTTTFVSPTQLTASIPQGLLTVGSYTVSVRTQDSQFSNGSFFFVNPGPSITAAGPERTAGSGAFTLQVIGSNFANNHTVRWDGTPLTTQFVNSGQVNGSVLAAMVTAGPHNITVATADGVVSAPFTYTVLPVPSITSLTPNTRSAGNGPFLLTIGGNNFQTGMSAFWNANPLGPVNYEGGQGSPDPTVTVPANLLTPGTHTVTLRTADGATSNGLPFVVNPAPSITSLNPPTRTAGSDTFSVTVVGANFPVGTVAYWDTSTALATSRIDAGTLSVTIPNTLVITAGAHNIDASTPDLKRSNAVAFTVLPLPTLNSISPGFRTQNNGPVTVTLTGTSFTAGMKLAANEASFDTNFVSSTQLTATLPAVFLNPPGLVPFNIRTTDFQYSNQVLFTIHPTPVITSISPTDRTAGNGPVTLFLNDTGNRFVPGEVAMWDNTPLITIVNNPGQLEAYLPANLITAGTHNVRVRTSDLVFSNGLSFVVTAAPVISSLSPLNRTAGNGPFTLVVAGSNFLQSTEVQWDSVTRATTFISATELRADIPAGQLTAGPHDVRVTTADGSFSNVVVYNVLAAPTITSLDPASRTAGHGPLSLAVNGTNFVSGMTVLYDGNAVPTTFNNAAKLTATIAANLLTAGKHNVSVRTQDLFVTPDVTFNVDPAPTVTTVSPATRTAGNGPIEITVTGTNFTASMTAYWDNTALTPTAFDSATQLRATVPANLLTTPSHLVTVRTSDGFASNSFSFAVTAGPSLTSLNPTSRTEGTAQFTLTVNGNNFVNGMEVRWDGAALPTTFVNAGSLTAQVAPTLLTAGPHNITVRTAPGETPQVNSNTLVFTVAAGPSISSLNPNSRTAGNGPMGLTVNGSNFAAGSTIYWDTTALTTTVVNAGQLTTTVAAALLTAGPHNVTVHTADGAVSAPALFTVNLLPTITGVDPVNRTAGNGPLDLTVHGAGFANGMTVYFDNTALTTTFGSSVQLTGALPAALLTAGTHQITVRTADGVSTNSASFTVAPPPTLSSLSPSSQTAGATALNLKVFGSNFLNGYRVYWDEAEQETTIFVSASELSVALKSGSLTPGNHNVRVRTSDGLFSNTLVFTVGAAPTVTSTNPTFRTAGNGPFLLTVTGTNFTNTSKIVFGGTELTTNFISAAQLTATVAASLLVYNPDSGGVDITVHTVDGAASNSVFFAIPRVPVLQSVTPGFRTAGNGPFSALVTGQGVRGVETVLWDGAAVTSAADDTGLRGTIPANLITEGTHQVTIKTPDGVVSNARPVLVFAAPTITALNPGARTVSSGAFPLVVTGTGYHDGDWSVRVTWDGTDLPTQLDSPTQLTATVNVGLVAGDHNVRVVTPDGVASNARVFVVNGVPTITSLTPSTRTAGNALASLQIAGSNFGPGMFARFGATQLDSTVVSGSLITAVVPAGLLTAGKHLVMVETGDAVTSNQLPFNVDAAPTLVSLDITTRSAGNGPFTLTITGANFQPDIVARFGATPLATTRVNDTTLTATVPAEVLTVGAHTVTARSADGFDANGLTFTVVARPVLSSLSPNSRTATASGFTMTLTGNSFASGMVVNWQQGEGSTDLNTTFVNATTLTAAVPGALLLNPGTANVRVRSTDQANSNSLPFTILPVPVLTSLNPVSVLAGSPNSGVLANGSNFVSGSVIILDGAAIPSTFHSTSSVGALLPTVLTSGGHNVAVQTPDGVTTSSLVLTVVAPLQILTAGLQAGVTGSPYSAVLQGSGGRQPYTWSASGLPDGLSLNPQTGGITGIPSGFGTSVVNVQLKDADNLTATTGYFLTIELSTGPLTFPPATLPQGIVGEPYSGALAVSGGKPAYTFSLTSGTLPPGLTLSNEGFIGGKPTAVGHYTFSVRVNDTNNGSATQTLAIDVVAPALLITTGSPLPEASVNGIVNVSFAAQGGVPGYTFSAAGSLPPGTQFANGTLSGSPTADGVFSFRVTVNDSNGSSTGKDFVLTVKPEPLTITTGSLPAGQLNAAYSTQFSAVGGTPSYTWTGSGFPASITINSAGVLSGVPGIEGKFSVSVTVTDSAGKSASKTLELTVEGEKLTLIGTLAKGTLGQAYGGSVGATGGSKPYSFTFAGLPGGLTGSTDGKAGGTPTAAGTFSVNVTVTDSKGTKASQTMSLEVVAPPIIILTSSLPNGLVGAAYNTNLSASGGVPPLAFSAAGVPDGLTLSPSGVLSGTPTAQGSPVLNVTVTDSTGATTAKALSFTIALPSAPPVTITGLSVTQIPGSQPRARATISAPFPLDITVTLTLTITPDTPPADPSAQFSTGGRVAILTIPAGSTSSTGDLGVQTGTTAATLTIVARSTAGGQDITPNPPPTTVIRVNAAPPSMSGATATKNGSTLTITISGIVSTKQVTSATFTFNPAPGANLQTTTVTVPVESLFNGWFQSSAASPFGGQFTFTQTFTVTGDINAIQSVTVTLTSSNGTSSPVTATVQ